MRLCSIKLLGMNVGISNVQPIIRCVLQHIASLEVKELPCTATLVRMLTEMKVLACQQLSEELSKQENLMLHSNGTSKFGQHYYLFLISTRHSVYTLGLPEMLTGSTTQVMHTYKKVLSDIELAAGPNSGNHILSEIKNTMSHRKELQPSSSELCTLQGIQVLACHYRQPLVTGLV